jgi:hypothetical protein
VGQMKLIKSLQRWVAHKAMPFVLAWRLCLGNTTTTRGIGGVEAKLMVTFLRQTWSLDGVILTLWPGWSDPWN